MATRTNKAPASVDELIGQLRQRGYTIRLYGLLTTGVAYEIHDGESFAIRTEAGLRNVWSRSDTYFRRAL